MSKIPIPGPNGTSWIETDPEPLTPEQHAEQDRINAKLDRTLTLIYQKKLAALGHPASFADAKALYDSGIEARSLIDEQYAELEAQHRFDEMIGSLEKIQRELGG